MVAGRYRIVELLGRGGMGEVYRADDLKLDQPVALKFLPSALARDPDALARFHNEVRIARQVSHPHVCRIHDVGDSDGTPFLSMEYIDGEDLASLLRRIGRLARDKAVDVARQLCSGLAAAHELGVLHRDLKPSNVMIDGRGRIKIADFGLAALADHLSQYDVAGTPAYMAPEQLAGKSATVKTDIYALGLVLYEVFTGAPAFRPGSREGRRRAAWAVVPQAPSSLVKDMDAGLDRVVMRCLDPDPSKRPASALEVLTMVPGDAGASTHGGRATVTRRWTWGITAMAAAMTVFLARHWYFVPHVHALTHTDAIVLADFDNKTGDSVFDDTLKQGLSVQLEQSPFLNVLSDRRVNEALRLMGRSATDRLTSAVSQEVCQRTGSTAIITGSIAALGYQYVIGLKAVNCNTGDMIAEAQQEAQSKESVLRALDAATLNLRSKLGESLGSVQKYATPLEEATTPSLEALKAYSSGVKMAARKEAAAALPLFKRALEIDPDFAMAQSVMGDLYSAVNEFETADEYARKAYALRERVGERERFYIENQHYVMTGQLDKMAQNLELWRQTYPRDSLAFLWLGFHSYYVGNWQQALEGFGEARRLDPDLVFAYWGIGTADTVLGRLDEAEAIFEQAEERKLETEMLAPARYGLAFLKADQKQMAQMISAAMGNPIVEHMALATQADTEAYYGKLRRSQELTERAIDSALHQDAKESAADYQVRAALREVEVGNRENARAAARAALRLAPTRFIRPVATLVLARAGDSSGAEQLADELDKARALDIGVQRYWLPSIRAAIALRRQEPNRAIEILRVSSAVELCQPSPITISLAPAYVRGNAYLMLHDGKRAAEEFQKFIDYRGLVLNFPWGALARLGLARAYGLENDSAKARAAYQDFLTLWKDADPDLPLLKQAQAEYARLK